MNNYVTTLDTYKELIDVIAGLKKTTMSTTIAVSKLEKIAEEMLEELSAIYSTDPEDVSPIVCEIDCSELNKKATETYEAADDTTDDASDADETDREYEAFKKAFYENQESVKKRSSGGFNVYKPEVVQEIYCPANIKNNIFRWADVAAHPNMFFAPFVLANWFDFAMAKESYTLDMREAVTEDARKLMAACGGTIGDFWKISYGYDANADDHFVEILVIAYGKVSVKIRMYWLAELVYNSKLLDLVDENGNPSGATLYNFVSHVNPIYISGTATRGLDVDESNLCSTAEIVLGMFLGEVSRATMIDYSQK
ncbi:MAG: hypothetical protein J6J36_04470 [Clostridia bacterium]|nr:hypothetical protein [Clostridia bacterium]